MYKDLEDTARQIRIDIIKMLEKAGLIVMSGQNSTFINIFKNVLANLQMWNSKEKRTARKAFSLENTYDKQINRIEKLIKLNYGY